MDSKNNRKVPYAIVWHKNELKMITSQNVGREHCVLENITKIKKTSVRLAKVGDKVKYKDLSILPDRCSIVSDMKITYFRKNGTVGTDKDLYPTSDGSNYGHFVRG